MLADFRSQLLQEQPFWCHPGTQAGNCCLFKLLTPPRTKCLPYAHLLSIDTLGDLLVSIRYSFADVDLSLSREFSGVPQFLDDLANFRVAGIAEGPLIAISIHLESPTDKPERF